MKQQARLKRPEGRRCVREPGVQCDRWHQRLVNELRGRRGFVNGVEEMMGGGLCRLVAAVRLQSRLTASSAYPPTPACAGSERGREKALENMPLENRVKQQRNPSTGGIQCTDIRKGAVWGSVETWAGIHGST